jgi:hypothetical protein
MRIEAKRKGLNLTFKEGIRQIMWFKSKNIKTKNKKWDVQDKRENKSLFANICKHEHEKNKTRLWCKIVPKIDVEQVEGNERSYFYLYPFGDLAQGSF